MADFTKAETYRRFDPVRGNPNIIQCPLDPETSHSEYIAWHDGFLRGVEQANAIWSRSCKAVSA